MYFFLVLDSGPRTVASAPFYPSLPSWLKTLGTPLIIAMSNKKCEKKDLLTFLNVLGYYFFSHEKKWTCMGFSKAFYEFKTDS